MFDCGCADRPKCECSGCEPLPAAVTVLVPHAKRDGAWFVKTKFMCLGHYRNYHGALNTPLRGLDPPPDADEDWRGSIMDIVRHALIAEAFEKRQRPPPMSRRRSTLPAKFVARLEQLCPTPPASGPASLGRR